MNIREMTIAGRIIRRASDSKELEEAVWTALDDQIARLNFSVVVDFDFKWQGRFIRQTYETPAEYPEFEAWGEKATINNRVQMIPVAKIKEVTLQELMKKSHKLEEAPEAIVESPEFFEVLRKTIKSYDLNYVEDVDVALEGHRTTFTKLDLKLEMAGGSVRVEGSLAKGEIEKIMEEVHENAEEWYPQRVEREYDPDR